MFTRRSACLAVIFLSSLAFGQGGTRYENHPVLVSRADGALTAHAATIAVCTQAASTGATPCSPLATLYTDATLSTPCTGTLKDGSVSGATNCSNPLTTDAKGNYHFYAPGVPYTIQVYGSGLVTSFEPDVNIAGSVAPNVGCKTFENIRCVDTANTGAWSGATWPAWINSAIADIVAAGFTTGIVDARGLMGSVPAGTVTLTIPAGIQVLWPPNNLNTSASPGLVLAGIGANVLGAGRDISKLTCTANNAKCVDITSSVAPAGRFYFEELRSLSITTTGSTSDAITMEDNLSNTTLYNLELRPTGKCVNAITGTGGALEMNFTQVRCDFPGDPTYGIFLDLSGGTAWTTTELNNVNVVQGNSIGIAFGNINVHVNGGSTDHTPTGWQVGGHAVMTNTDAESASTVGYAILEAGVVEMHQPQCQANAQCIRVDAANSNTEIINPVSGGTTGTNDITYSAVSTGTHRVTGTNLLQKPIVATPPAVVCIVKGSVTTCQNTVPQSNNTAMSQGGYTNATTTPSNITGLSFPVLASTNYVMHCDLYYQGSAATAGLDVTITGPSAPNNIFYSYDEDVTATTVQNAIASAFGTKLVGNATVTGTTNLHATVTMGLRNGVNAGTIQVQGSATGAGTVTVQNGSFCVLQ